MKWGNPSARERGLESVGNHMTIIRAATELDLDRVLALVAQAFNIDPSSHDRIRKEMKVELVRVAEVDGAVKATARFIPFGHYYGGRAVKAAGIAGVAVAPDMRGRGLGTQVMRSLLTELREQNYPLSSLYPATSPIYRAVGYGYGSIRTSWKARLDSLPATAAVGVDVTEMTEEDLEEVRRAYAAFAATQAGLLDRPEDWWRKRVLLDHDGREYYRYVVRESGHVTGWIVYRLVGSKDDWRSDVQCRDLIWTTPRACRALLGLAALHRSTSSSMSWIGPPSDPLADLLHEDDIKHDGAFRTMARLLDVPAALEARGYNPAVDATVSIGVTDPLFEQNRGPWRIEVSDGQAKCVAVDDADATTDVQTLAQLWTGLTTPADAARTGLLTATREAMDALAAMFAGPVPWIGDFY